MKKTILLTGCSGTIGSRLAKKMVSAGINVVPLSLREHTTTIPQAEEPSKILTIYDLDHITNKEGFSFDGIIHTATCQGRQGESEDEIFKVNFELPKLLLNYALNNDIKTFINCSTSLPDNLNYYARSKSEFEKFASKIVSGRNLNFINFKIEAVYGGHSRISFIDSILKKCIDNEEFIELTSGIQVRDFIHVDDVTDILHQSALMNGQPRFLNVPMGTGKGASIRQIAEFIKGLTNSQTKLLFGKIPMRENEPLKLVSDTKTLNSLNMKTNISIEQGIERLHRELTIGQ